jgi:HK97 family phage major capsid protein
MSSDQLYVPAELTLPAVAWKGESVQLAQSDPTYAQVSLAAKKLTAYSAATNELLSDSAMDVVGMLTRQFVYGIGMELDNQMLNGTGDPVSGVLTAKAGYSVSSTGTSFSNVTGTDISLMVSKIEEGWARDARFIFGRLGMHYIRTLKDSQNNFIFSQIGGGQQKSIWDYPANMSEKITNTDADATAYGVFGNFKYFYIGRRQGAMAIEVDPYTRFDYAETRFRMVTRWAMAVAQANAFCRLLS